MNLTFEEMIVLKYPHDASWLFCSQQHYIFLVAAIWNNLYSCKRVLNVLLWKTNILNSFYLIFKISLCIQHSFILWTYDVYFSSHSKLKDLLFDHGLSAFLTICIFQLLIETLWADFNQTWNTASFGEGISSLFKS